MFNIVLYIIIEKGIYPAKTLFFFNGKIDMYNQAAQMLYFSFKFQFPSTEEWKNRILAYKGLENIEQLFEENTDFETQPLLKDLLVLKELAWKLHGSITFSESQFYQEAGDIPGDIPYLSITLTIPLTTAGFERDFEKVNLEKEIKKENLEKKEAKILLMNLAFAKTKNHENFFT